MNLGILARTDFLLFTAARVVGIGIRPLILFIAATRGFNDFSDAFALFATSVAGSFVVFSNEAHIRLYRAEFNGTNNLLRLYLATRYFIINLASHVVWFSALGAILLYVWTGNVWLSAFGLIVLLAEKTYDEFQRYYTYQRAYIKWTIGFAFRYGLPGLAVLIPMAVGLTPSLALYVGAYIVACVLYVGIWERRSMALYARIFARYWRRGRVLWGYLRTYARDLYANQAWSLLAANFYLLDRMMISQTDVSLGNYVFFCNLFNLAVFTHTTLYYMHRRPDLIKDHASLRHEFFRLPNIVPPVIYTAGVAALAWLLTIYSPVYQSFEKTIILGIAIYFFTQAASLVVLEFIFWRVQKEKLVAADIVVGAIGFGAFFGFRLPTDLIPSLMALLVGSRVFAYALLWRSERNRIATS